MTSRIKVNKYWHDVKSGSTTILQMRQRHENVFVSRKSSALRVKSRDVYLFGKRKHQGFLHSLVSEKEKYTDFGCLKHKIMLSLFGGNSKTYQGLFKLIEIMPEARYQPQLILLYRVLKGNKQRTNT